MRSLDYATNVALWFLSADKPSAESKFIIQTMCNILVISMIYMHVHHKKEGIFDAQSINVNFVIQSFFSL